MGEEDIATTFAHSAGVGDISFHPDGKTLASCGTDAFVRIHTLEASATSDTDEQETLELTDPITTVSFHPEGKYLAVGGLDNTVKVYEFPSCDLSCIAARSVQQVNCVAWSTNGQQLAIATGEPIVRVAQFPEVSNSASLRGHNCGVVSVSFDPKNQYLLSAGTDGSFIVWDATKEADPVKIFKSSVPRPASSVDQPLQVSWHPEGKAIMLPGQTEVRSLPRDLKQISNVHSNHTQEVSCVSFSPNGLYVASAGLDNKLVVWDMTTKEVLKTFSHDETILSIEWNPKENSIALFDNCGQYGIVKSVVPDDCKKPYEKVTRAPAKAAVENEDNSHGGDAFVDDEVDEADEGEDILRDDISLDADRQDHAAENGELEAELGDFIVKDNPKHLLSKQEVKVTRQLISAAPQESFQPSATPAGEKRRFLAWDLTGIITSRDEHTYNSVEIEFHDVSQRPVRMTDRYNFSMAALGKHGAVFASKRTSEAVPSCIYYRIFDSWAHNSDWTLNLPSSEEVIAVATGDDFVAASTSLNNLRVFTTTGIQVNVMTLEGPIVCLAAHGAYLAAVYHSGPTLFGNEHLTAVVYDIKSSSKLISCRVPLTAGATVEWAGFNDDTMLCVYDSNGILRALSGEFDGSWTPVLDASQTKQSAEDKYWVVGVTSTHLMAVVLKGGEEFPSPLPRPVITDVPLAIPLLSSDVGDESLEESLAQARLALRWKEFCNASPEDITSMEVDYDEILIRMMHVACQKEKSARALDLGKLMNLRKSLELSCVLANRHNLPNLAERLEEIIESYSPPSERRRRLRPQKRVYGRQEEEPLEDPSEDGDDDDENTPEDSMNDTLGSQMDSQGSTLHKSFLKRERDGNPKSPVKKASSNPFARMDKPKPFVSPSKTIFDSLSRIQTKEGKGSPNKRRKPLVQNKGKKLFFNA